MSLGIAIYVFLSAAWFACCAVGTSHREDELNAAGQDPLDRAAGQTLTWLFTIMALVGLVLVAKACG